MIVVLFPIRGVTVVVFSTTKRVMVVVFTRQIG